MMQDGTLISAEPVAIPQTMLNIQKRALNAQDFQAFAAVQMYKIVYASNGLRIAGYMALPPARQGIEQWPALIFNRGGAGEKGALTPESAAMYAGIYASWGYVVVASQYRGQGGSEGPEEWGQGDVHDAEALIPLLQGLHYVDNNRIGLIGGSRGGMMALMMLRRNSLFKAAATIGAPTAFHKAPHDSYIWRTFARFIPSGTNMQEEALKRSGAAFAQEICKTTPLLVLHGTGDRRIEPWHGYELGMALQQVQHPYKLVMYENADHILSGRRQESNAEIRSWIDTYVRDLAKLPRTGPHGA